MGDSIHFLRKLWVNKLGWNFLYSLRMFIAIELEAAFFVNILRKINYATWRLSKENNKKRLFEILLERVRDFSVQNTFTVQK